MKFIFSLASGKSYFLSPRLINLNSSKTPAEHRCSTITFHLNDPEPPCCPSTPERRQPSLRVVFPCAIYFSPIFCFPCSVVSTLRASRSRSLVAGPPGPHPHPPGPHPHPPHPPHEGTPAPSPGQIGEEYAEYDFVMESFSLRSYFEGPSSDVDAEGQDHRAPPGPPGPHPGEKKCRRCKAQPRQHGRLWWWSWWHVVWAW